MYPREKRELAQSAMSTYLDAVLEGLTERGWEEEAATFLMFQAADKLEALGKLPPFPVKDRDWEGMARWVVRAKDLGYEKFVEKCAALLEAEADG